MPSKRSRRARKKRKLAEKIADSYFKPRPSSNWAYPGEDHIKEGGPRVSYLSRKGWKTR